MGTSNDPTIDNDSWAEKVFRSVPHYAQELRCKCVPDVPYYLDTASLPHAFVNGMWVHTECLKPTRYSLVHYLKECESCERYFIPDSQSERVFLCGGCRSKVATRPRRKRENV